MDGIWVDAPIVELTKWGGWLVRTPPTHQFRLAAVSSDRAAAIEELNRAVAAWSALANAKAR